MFPRRLRSERFRSRNSSPSAYGATRCHRWWEWPKPRPRDAPVERVSIGRFRVPRDRYCQHSPLTMKEAKASLDFLARLHAWAWQTPARYRGFPDAVGASLETASEKEKQDFVAAVSTASGSSARLFERGCYWDLSRRGADELDGMPGVWDQFLRYWSGCGWPCLALPQFRSLGRRLRAAAPRVIQDLHGAHVIGDKVTTIADDAGRNSGAKLQYRTLVHGDFKAMNLFVPSNSSDAAACKAEGEEEGDDYVYSSGQKNESFQRGVIAIDFQWTGGSGECGGMQDVAMHLFHSVHPDCLEGGGERALLTHYYECLCLHLKRPEPGLEQHAQP